MKRLVVFGTFALVVGVAVVSAILGSSGLYGLLPASSSASATPAPPSREGLLRIEMAVLTSRGISPARASETIDVQGKVARSGLIGKIEAATAGAFGGVWFDPASATLRIGVTSRASRRVVAAVAARAGLASDVVEAPVGSTWGQLQAAQARWNRRLADLFARAQVRTGLTPQNNSVLVTLSSSVPAARRAALKRQAATADVKVDVGVVPSSQFAVSRDSPSTVCSPFAAGTKASCNPSLTAGVTIAGPTVCTAGPLVIPKASKNETDVLTAGHCIEKGGIGSKWFALNASGTKIEIGPATEFVNGTKGDVGAIRITNAGWMTGKEKDPVLAVTAQWTKNQEMSYPVEGERAPAAKNLTCHEGQSTGESCGEIMAVGVTETLGGEIVENVVEVLGGIRAGGDSGGPWMFIQNNASKTVLMEGTHIAGAEPRLYYEPLNLVYRQLTKLNLELLTTGNENRP